MAYQLAMEIYELSKYWRRVQKTALPHFTSKMTDSDGEASEVTFFLDFAKDCGYLQSDIRASLIQRYSEVGKMLGSMINNPEKFLPKSS